MRPLKQENFYSMVKKSTASFSNLVILHSFSTPALGDPLSKTIVIRSPAPSGCSEGIEVQMTCAFLRCRIAVASLFPIMQVHSKLRVLYTTPLASKSRCVRYSLFYLVFYALRSCANHVSWNSPKRFILFILLTNCPVFFYAGRTSPCCHLWFDELVRK